MRTLEGAMVDEGMGVLRFVALFAGLVALAEFLARRTIMPPEGTRKLVHLGGGLGCLLFPFFLESALTVLVLALGFGGVFWVGERKGWLQSLCRVSRRSCGSVYYPFAVAVLFALTADRYGLYMSAVLVLAVSDTAAALVGTRYGRIHFRTGGVEERKSLEGSLMFWTLTFLVVSLPLVFLDGTERTTALLAGFITATLLTAVEAVSIGGRDNLYVPILASFILLKVVSKSVAELVMQSVSLVLLFVFLTLMNRYGRMLRTRELVIVSIFVYGVWSLGSVDWAIPVLAGFLVFAVVFKWSGMEQRRTRVYRRMALLASPAALLALLANLTGLFAFGYAPFLAGVLVPTIWGVVVQGEGEVRGGIWRWSWRQVGSALATLSLVLAGPLLRGRAPEVFSVLVLAGLCLAFVWVGLVLTARGLILSGGRAVVLMSCLAMALTAGGQVGGWLSCWRPTLWADRYAREADVLFPLFPRSPDEKGVRLCE